MIPKEEAESEGLSSSLSFTYCEPDGDLKQGDILKRIPEIDELMKKVHPHFSESYYTHFMIITQSCDLVQREKGQSSTKECKSRYITLAPIRLLEDILLRELNNFQDELDKRGEVCSNSNKFKIKQFVARMLNNNEDEYFYLYKQGCPNIQDLKGYMLA